jgi:DUF971 family protein
MVNTMTPPPVSLNLKRDEKLEVLWQDGKRSVYSITLLRTMCPCALCKTVREGQKKGLDAPAVQVAEQPKKRSLSILPGNFSEPLKVLDAEMVGGYAIRLEWSDKHGSGIYSWEYLREIAPPDQSR